MREYADFKGKNISVVRRGFLLEFLSCASPSLIFGRIFIAAFSSLPVFILPFIKYKNVAKHRLLFMSLVTFNPLFLKLSSMYLTDAVFFTLIVIFVYLKSKKLETQASIISCVSILVRYEGVLLVLINLIDLILSKKVKYALIQLLLLSFFIPLIFKGIELYFVHHLKASHEVPYFYYLLTPFMVQGLLFIFLPYALITQFGKNKLLDLLFVGFISLYFLFHVGGTFSDRFRYVLPTLLSTSYYIIGIADEKFKRLIVLFLILNLSLLVPLYDYKPFRQYLKELLQNVVNFLM